MEWKRILSISLIVSVIFLLGCDEDDHGISAEAKAFANEHWQYGGPGIGEEPYDNYFQYEYWVAAVYGADGDITLDDNFQGSLDEWHEHVWTEKLEYLPAYGFEHEITPDQKNNTYYINIGVQDQFAAGWDDYQWENYPFDDWRPNEMITPHRDQYLDMIGR